MATGTANRAGSEYRDLSERVRAAGLMNRRRGYYARKISLTVLAFSGAWAGLFFLGNSWAAMGIAALMAVMFTQVVFVGHDAGHQQIARSRRVNRLIGLGVGNLLTGLSFGWWLPKHNAHHTHPNQVDRDPDVGAGVVAFTPAATAQRRGAGRFLARWQAWTFFPLLLLEAIALRRSSVLKVIRDRDRSAAVEGGLLVVHAAAYLIVIFWVLSPLRALAFIGIQQGLFGLYLGLTFAPNHTGMPILDHDSELSFARRQIITARNLVGGRITALTFGGLNYQIEHHLFPTMPRPNLARAQPLVKAFCRDHNLAYHEDTLVGSYRDALRYLHAVGQPTTDPAVGLAGA